jgi:hypothetical protein
MARVARVGVACLAGVSLAALSPPTLAARSPTVPAAAAAAKLAGIIRRDARLQFRRFPHAVTVTRRCCSVRVLRVHYHARVSGGGSDAYTMRVETQRGRVLGVALFERSSEEGLEHEGKREKATAAYVFALKHEGSGGNGSWRLTVSAVEASSTGGGSGPRSGISSFIECRPPPPLPRALYERALTSLGRARHHFRAAFQVLALSACQ